ncbi:MAG TPA: hypothetical protein VFI73_03495 [Candidatus Nitrosopolaris sp.]|nr:hypothetical protein [Candidatus Nitrosopolaris sp.]
MIPDTKIIIPTPITTEPLTVQSGLLNIKEEDGPTIRLLCNVNNTPNVSIMKPATPNTLPMYFGIIRQRDIHVQTTYTYFTVMFLRKLAEAISSPTQAHHE